LDLWVLDFEFEMNHIAILGLGLMGGSLGLALRASGYTGRITGSTRSPERRELARKRGAVDEAFSSPSAAAMGADIVVLCAPILAMPELFRAAAPCIAQGAVVTDVGSTKAYLVRELTPLAEQAGATFLGSHPIAGSEQQGIASARDNLYQGAVVVLTPQAGTPAAATAEVEALWTRVGALTRTIDADEHDRIMAATSHFPHLAAALVAITAGRRGRADAYGPYCGPGFRDTTRIAEGAPDVWVDILATNRERVLDELRTFKREADGLIDLLSRNDLKGLEALLEQGRTMRRTLVDRAGKAM
jgi:prephenate dehydrogenase